MDFIVSYRLYSKIVKKQNKKAKEEVKYQIEKEPVYQTCNLCGQYIYSCQCDLIKLRSFDPEKSNY